MSIGFNGVFEFIFKSGCLDIFNFEAGILHFYPSVASLHLGLLHLGQLLHKGLQQPTGQNISGLFVMNFTSHVIKRRCPSGFGPP